MDIIPDGFILNLEIIFPNGKFLAERTSNKSFGIVEGLSIIGTSAETYSSASPDQLEEAKTNLSKLIQNDFKGEVVFVIGENGLNLAKTHNVNLPIIKIGNWIGPLLVDAAIKKVKTVILFGYHGKLIKFVGTGLLRGYFSKVTNVQTSKFCVTSRSKPDFAKVIPSACESFLSKPTE